MFPSNNGQFTNNNPSQNTGNLNLGPFFVPNQLALPHPFYQQPHPQYARTTEFHRFVIAQNLAYQALQFQAQAQATAQQNMQSVQHAQASHLSRMSLLTHPQSRCSLVPSKSILASKPRSSQISSLIDIESRRRPSLISDFAAAPVSSSDHCTTIEDVISDAQKPKTSNIPQTSSNIDEIAEIKKNHLTDKLDNIMKEKRHIDGQLAVIVRKKEQHQSELKKLNVDGVDDEKENEENLDDELDGSKSIMEKIYRENRKTAFLSHSNYEGKLNLKRIIVPMYHFPNDYPIVRETVARRESTFPFLVKSLVEKREQENSIKEQIIEKYNKLYAEWDRKNQRFNSSAKKTARALKNREIYEKMFPEVRKAREDRERNHRENEMEEERRRQVSAALPPMLLLNVNNGCFSNHNGLASDPLTDSKKRIENFLSSWSEEEKELFKEQICTFGKNFAAISFVLGSKSVKDCVTYYYATKKRQNYKAMIKKKKKPTKGGYRPPIIPRTDEVFSRMQQESCVTTRGSTETECCMCKAKIDIGTNPSRILTRSSYETYGIGQANINASVDVRICQRCHAKAMKSKTARCPLGTCNNAKRKSKPTRPMPTKWNLLTVKQKQFLMHIFHFTEDDVKCCFSCYKKISKKLESLLVGDLDEEVNQWEEAVKNERTENETAENLEKDLSTIPEALESEEEEGTDSEKIPSPMPEDVKKENVEADNDWSSSATLSDELMADTVAANASNASPVVASKSPMPYKPRFRGRPFDTRIIKKEVPVTEPSVSLSGEDFMILDKKSTLLPSTSSSTVDLDFSRMHLTKEELPPTVKKETVANEATSEMNQILTPSTVLQPVHHLSAPVVTSASFSSIGIARGSITQGTPVLRSPSTPATEVMEKTRFIQTTPLNSSINISIPTTTSVQPIGNINSGRNTSDATSSLNQTPLFTGINQQTPTEAQFNHLPTNVLNQLITMDGQLAMVKFLQQMRQSEAERMQMALLQSRGYQVNLIDLYRQMANNASSTDFHSSVQQQQQQQQNSLLNEHLFLLQQQLFKQQQQNHAVANNLQQTIASHYLSNLSRVQQPAQVLAQNPIEQQQNHNSVASNISDPRHINLQANAQLLGDLRNAEQLKKENDSKQLLEAQKQAEEARNLAGLDQFRNLMRAPNMQPYMQPYAYKSMDQLNDELAIAHNYKMLWDERAQRPDLLQSSLPSSLGVIVRGMGEERTNFSAGLMSKGAVKEFPPTVPKTPIGVNPRESLAQSQPQAAFPGIIGINHPQQADGSNKRLTTQSTRTQLTPQQNTSEKVLARPLPSDYVHSLNQMTKRTQQEILSSKKTTDSNSASILALSKQPAGRSSQAIEDLHQEQPFVNCELKRKSGIHTVYLPSLPGPHHHHPISKTQSATYRRAVSPSNTPPSHNISTTNASTVVVPLLSLSNVHTSSPLQPTPLHCPVCIAPTPLIQSSNVFLSCPASSSVEVSVTDCPVTTSCSTMLVSPKSPFVSALQSAQAGVAQNQSAYSVRSFTPSSSPFQQISPSFSSKSPTSLARGISSNIAYHQRPSPLEFPTPAPVKSSEQAAQSSVNSNLFQPHVSQSWKSESGEPICVQLETSTPTNSNFEPLSPDTSESQAPSSVVSESVSPSCVRLFSLLNLPDSGSSNPAPLCPVLPSSKFADYQSEQNITTDPPAIQKDLCKLIPQPTYEPLSDDD